MKKYNFGNSVRYHVTLLDITNHWFDSNVFCNLRAVRARSSQMSGVWGRQTVINVGTGEGWLLVRLELNGKEIARARGFLARRAFYLSNAKEKRILTK